MQIKLLKFNKKYWNSLPEDKNKIYFQPEKGIYQIIEFDGEKSGIEGVILSKEKEGIGFFQIYLEKKFRGKDILKKVVDIIYNKYRLKKLIATRKKDNLQSLNAHRKAGFIEEYGKTQNKLKEMGLQKEDEVRFIYRD